MRCFGHRRLVPAAFLLLVRFSLAEVFRPGDVVPMSYKYVQETGTTADEGWETWDDVLRSQMPRYGRSSALTFTPVLPDSYSAKEKLTVAFSFSKERLAPPRVVVRGAGGGERLHRLTLTFIYAAGDIVRIRSEPNYRATTEDGPDHGGFDIEYRWDRLPEEDEQAGVSLIFIVALIVTVVLGLDVCNSVGHTEVESNRGEGSGAHGGFGRAGEGERRQR